MSEFKKPVDKNFTVFGCSFNNNFITRVCEYHVPNQETAVTLFYAQHMKTREGKAIVYISGVEDIDLYEISRTRGANGFIQIKKISSMTKRNEVQAPGMVPEKSNDDKT